MKVEPECALCLLERGYREIIRATNDSKIRFKAASVILTVVSSGFNLNAVPARIGTSRDRTIKRMTGRDPYKEERRRSNIIALKLLPKVESMIKRRKTGYERFKMACMSSIVGNIIEFDIIGHDFNFNELENLIRTAKLTIDHTEKIYKLIKKAKSAMFLPDNAGEIAFDTLLVNEIRRLGPKVTVAVKAAPILNDATMKDAREVGMEKVADELITIGTDTVGLLLEETPPEFRRKISKSDIIIAKGMANYETLTETKLKKPIAFLFRAKCNPVARSVKVDKGSNVALLLEK